MAGLALAIGAGALITLGADHRIGRSVAPGAPRSRPNPSSRQALIDTLAVLRRPQTVADRRVPLPFSFTHRRDSPFYARFGGVDRSLIRIATKAPWGRDIILIPVKPRHAPTPQGFRQEGLFVEDRGGGGGCCDTARGIRAEGGGGLSSGSGRGRIDVVLVLPDGVARISILAHYRHQVMLSAVVHNNVAAFYAPGNPDSLKSEITWYGPSGNVIKRFSGQPF